MNTKKVTDKTERKKLKRTARKKAAPKAKRPAPETGERALSCAEGRIAASLVRPGHWRRSARIGYGTRVPSEF